MRLPRGEGRDFAVQTLQRVTDDERCAAFELQACDDHSAGGLGRKHLGRDAFIDDVLACVSEARCPVEHGAGGECVDACVCETQAHAFPITERAAMRMGRAQARLEVGEGELHEAARLRGNNEAHVADLTHGARQSLSRSADDLIRRDRNVCERERDVV